MRSGTNPTIGTGALLTRLLRFARNDTVSDCHCEERSDEAISPMGAAAGLIRLV